MLARAEGSQPQARIFPNGVAMNERPDAPLPDDPHAAQNEDLGSGMSDDPRVDPTPDRRHSEGPVDGARTSALGIADPTAS